MHEYIDREALQDALYESDAITMRGVAILNQFPAANVVPVRHGRWKPHSKVEVPVFHCSVCGGAALHAFGRQCKSNFCPNCGAKMDLKDSDGE